MKKTFLMGVALVGLSVGSLGSASAADLAARPYTKAPVMAPAFSWTGCYVGAHIGWGWAQKNITETDNSFGPNGGAATGNLDASGGLFGGQVGCNYQFGGNWVVGIQGDAAGTDINGVANDPLGQLSTLFGRSSNSNIVSVKMDYLASVTARVGITAWNNQALFYVKGGGAWTRDKWDFHNTFSTFGAVPEWNQDRFGWTIGGGLEWAWLSVSPNLSSFVEFNYYDFGNKSDAFAVRQCSECGLNLTSFGAKQQIETVKIGVNYRFYQ